jgi:DNA polymerase-1
MTCQNPCLQSLKNDPQFRAALIPAPGYRFVRCDYAQADLRVLAFKAQDPSLNEALAPDHDFHRYMAANMLGKSPESVTAEERKLSKAIIYGVSYVMTPEGLANEARLSFGLTWTARQAQDFLEHFFDTYPGMRAFYNQTREEAQTSTEARTVHHRRRRLLPGGPEHVTYRLRRMLNLTSL